VTLIQSHPKPFRQFPLFLQLLPRPSLIDRQADLLLAHGRTKQAERLAHQAAALREVTR